MKRSASERSFARGLRSQERGNLFEALAYFEAALRLDEGARHAPRRARCASHYGYCLAAALGKTREGLQYCTRAATSDPFSPDIFLNLARVHIIAGDRRGAWKALVRGLSLDPGHRSIRREMKGMGLRRRPVLPFLDRSHVLNRAAGQIATRLGQKAAVRPPEEKKKKTTFSWWS